MSNSAFCNSLTFFAQKPADETPLPLCLQFKNRSPFNGFYTNDWPGSEMTRYATFDSFLLSPSPAFVVWK
jgi:hypothetical protein